MPRRPGSLRDTSESAHAREQYHNPGPIMSGIDDDVGNKDDIAL